MSNTPSANQLAWLVERQENGRAVWCTANYQWTTDANEAAWFVRKLDAELFCWNLSGEANAVEHMFCSLPEVSEERCAKCQQSRPCKCQMSGGNFSYE